MSYPFKNVKRAAEIITVGKYIEKYQPGLLLDLNPITQRPPIFLAVDNTKSIEIVQTALMGVSLVLLPLSKIQKVLRSSGSHLMVVTVNVLFMVMSMVTLLLMVSFMMTFQMRKSQSFLIHNLFLMFTNQ